MKRADKIIATVSILWLLFIATAILTATPRPPTVTCVTKPVASDSVSITDIYDIPGQQPATQIMLFDAETNTVCWVF